MESSAQFFQILQSLGEQLPTFIAMVVGLIFATTRWKQYPRVAMLVIIAFIFLILHQVIFAVVYTVVPRWFIESAGSYENIRQVIDRVYMVLGLLSNGTAAIGFVMLLVAIFMGRRAEPALEN